MFDKTFFNLYFNLSTYLNIGLLSIIFGTRILSGLSVGGGGFEDLALKSNGISDPAVVAGRFITW